MTTPVSFELAKLLKEKGFESKSHIAEYWNVEGEQLLVETWEDEYDSFHHEDCPDDITFVCLAPTISEVVMWCFNKYKYSIEYSMNIPESGEYDGCYVFNGLIKGSEDYKLKIFYTSKDYPTIEKALETAIEYTLNNLI